MGSSERQQKKNECRAAMPGTRTQVSDNVLTSAAREGLREQRGLQAQGL